MSSSHPAVKRQPVDPEAPAPGTVVRDDDAGEDVDRNPRHLRGGATGSTWLDGFGGGTEALRSPLVAVRNSINLPDSWLSVCGMDVRYPSKKRHYWLSRCHYGGNL